MIFAIPEFTPSLCCDLGTTCVLEFNSAPCWLGCICGFLTVITSPGPISLVKNAVDVSNTDSSSAVIISVVVAVSGPRVEEKSPSVTALSTPPASAAANDDGDGCICVPKIGAGVFDAFPPWNATGTGSPWTFNWISDVDTLVALGLIVHVPAPLLCVTTFVKFCGCRYGCTISVSVTFGFDVNIISDELCHLQHLGIRKLQLLEFRPTLDN